MQISECHSVKERLMGRLLQMHRQDNAKGKSKWAAARMSEEALDWVVAAGTPQARSSRNIRKTNEPRMEARNKLPPCQVLDNLHGGMFTVWLLSLF